MGKKKESWGRFNLTQMSKPEFGRPYRVIENPGA